MLVVHGHKGEQSAYESSAARGINRRVVGEDCAREMSLLNNLPLARLSIRAKPSEIALIKPSKGLISGAATARRRKKRLAAGRTIHRLRKKQPIALAKAIVSMATTSLHYGQSRLLSIAQIDEDIR